MIAPFAGIIQDVPANQVEEYKRYGMEILKPEDKLWGGIDNYANVDVLNTSDRVGSEIRNHNGASISTVNTGSGSKTDIKNSGYIGTINTGDNSNTTVNNRSIIDTLNTGKNSNLTLDNSGQITTVKIGEESIATINNSGIIGTITAGKISDKKDNKGMTITNSGFIGEIHTGENSENEINTEEGHIDWLETGLGNESKVSGADRITKKGGKGNLLYKMVSKDGRDIKWVDDWDILKQNDLISKKYSYCYSNTGPIKSNIRSIKVSIDSSGTTYTVVTLKNGSIAISIKSINGREVSFDAKAIKEYVINAKNSGFGNESEAADSVSRIWDRTLSTPVAKGGTSGIEKGSYEYYALVYMSMQNELGRFYEYVELIDLMVNTTTMLAGVGMAAYEINTIKSMRQRSLSTGRAMIADEVTLKELGNRGNLGICFTGDTLIKTDTGHKQICNIKVGDKVYSEDIETGEKGYNVVKQIFINDTYRVLHISINNREIKTTFPHPFYVVGKGWTEAKDLKVGDILKQSNDKTTEVNGLEVEELETPIKVYNFEVENWHTYYVSEDDILVHNVGSNPCAQGGSNAWKSITEEKSVSRVAGSLSSNQQKIYNDTLTKLANGDTTGLNVHPVKNNWLSADLNGFGKGRGNARIYYTEKSGVITIQEIDLAHMK